jgi:hypothetical protein
MASVKKIAVVAEDKLTEAVLLKCLSAYAPGYTVVRSEVANGRGNVQRDLPAYKALAASMPVLIGVDLDHDACAPSVLAKWGTQQPTVDNLLLRFAVREVESWVLADRSRISTFINAPIKSLSLDPDSLEDPKLSFLSIARQTASRELKAALVPANFNKYPRIGPAYNLRMCEFVRNKWRPHVAMTKSDSLRRAILALQAI